MGRQYYCDYCDRRFKDLPQNRKRHLKSSEHLTARRLHLESMKSGHELARDELMKQPCNHFVRHGYCKFGLTCIHSHLTHDLLQDIKARMAADGHHLQWPSLPVSPDQLVDQSIYGNHVLNKWLNTRHFHNNNDNTITMTTDDDNSSGDRLGSYSWVDSSDNLQEVRHLLSTIDKSLIPVSLIPPSVEDFNLRPDIDWCE